MDTAHVSAPRRPRRSGWLSTALVAGFLLTVGASPALAGGGGNLGLPTAPRAALPTAPTPSGTTPRYYLSLGDSLAAGYQPDASGQTRSTTQGYVDVVGAYARRFYPALRLIKLGGGGTSQSFIYAQQHARSQLQRAETFLRAHHSDTVLITVNIGDNDVEHCIHPTGIDYGCVHRGMRAVRRNLVTIGRRLRQVARRAVPIVGISDYDQMWAFWLRDASGQSIALQSAGIVSALNHTIGRSWRRTGVLVADAGPAFHTLDERPVAFGGYGNVPRAVRVICNLTWACSPPPINFNDHANSRGYRLIGRVVIRALGHRLPDAARATRAAP